MEFLDDFFDLDELMAASADPHGGDNNNNNNNGNEGGGGCVSNGNGNNSGIPVPVAADDYYNHVFGLIAFKLWHKVDRRLSLDWSGKEIALIHHLFNKYASDSIMTKCAKIAQELNDKSITDVILYHKWLIEKMQSYKYQGKNQFNTDIAKKQENIKRRKDDDNSSRKDKGKKVEVADPSAKSSSYLTNGHPYAQTAASMDIDDDISYKVFGGATGRLLEQNDQYMDQISANFRAFKIHDNINLFCQTRDNILSILNDLKDVPEVMRNMPPLPVKLNEELCRNLLPPSSY